MSPMHGQGRARPRARMESLMCPALIRRLSCLVDVECEMPLPTICRAVAQFTQTRRSPK